MNNTGSKYGFFKSFDEMQKTLERLNLTTADDYHRKTAQVQFKLPIIKHRALIAAQDNSDPTKNMDNKEALIYHIPEVVLRRKWKSDHHNLINHESVVIKPSNRIQYTREIKLSAQIARVSGRYPNRSVPKSPKFKIILPSQLK